MHYQKSVFVTLSLVMTISLAVFANTHPGTRNALDARHVFHLSSDYVTDEVCVPMVGMHYLDLTKAIYGNPQVGFDTNGKMLFIQYLFSSDEFDAQVKAGLLTNLKTNRNASIERIKIKFGQARPEYIPPQYIDIVCNPEKPESNLCAPHYDVTLFVVKDWRLEKACGGAQVPTRFPDPRYSRARESAQKKSSLDPSYSFSNLLEK